MIPRLRLLRRLLHLLHLRLRQLDNGLLFTLFVPVPFHIIFRLLCTVSLAA